VDLNTITSYRNAQSRADLVLSPGERFLAGGTWFFGEPQPDVTGLVDLTTLGWPDLEITAQGLRISATCTIARLVAFGENRATGVPALPHDWAAASLFATAANALLASFKIWNTATVGGNVCRSYAAAAMVSLTVALDGVAEVWTPDGGTRCIPVADLITGNGTNSLQHGEILRGIDLPLYALRSRARLHKIALTELGRSGAVVTGRVDKDGTAVFTVTAATLAPTVLRFAAPPDAASLRAAVTDAPGYYSDPLGTADWRRGVSAVLAERIRRELDAAQERTS
jgi:CO/xanthine dehydrogenase FAD-binding subunit